MITDEAIRDCLFRLLEERRPDATVCPSDVARALAVDWRPWMPRVRAVAAALAERGEVVISQRGVPVDPEAIRGPIRIGRPRPASEPRPRRRP